MLCKLTKQDGAVVQKGTQDSTPTEIKQMEEAKTITEKQELIEEHSEMLPQFRDRHDMQQKKLKKDMERQGVFAVVEGQNEEFEVQDVVIDKEFLNNVKSFEDVNEMSPQERKVFYEDVLKVKFPKTNFSKRLNANYKEPLHIPLLTWQLYNWQHFTRQDRPTWVTHDGPAFTSGTPHLGLFYNKVIMSPITHLTV